MEEEISSGGRKREGKMRGKKGARGEKVKSQKSKEKKSEKEIGTK